MTHWELGNAVQPPRRRALPSPACGAMPRMLFWKLAFSAIWAALAVYLWRR